MPRIPTLTIENAGPEAARVLRDIKAKVGAVPNLYAAVANSPETLEGFLSFGAALEDGPIDAALREQIAVAIAGVNACEYCASAHTFIGDKLGVDKDELSANLRGESGDARTAAAVSLARRIVETKGYVTDEELHAVRDAGFSDREIVAIIGLVAINTFTNFFNHVAQTEVDFPRVALPEPVSV